MAFYVEHRHQGPGKRKTTKPTAWEVAAEEFLNGLLCHYEPPQNPYEIMDAEAAESDFHDQLMLQRPPSILKTSRSFETKKHKSKKGRSVRFHGLVNQKHSSGGSSGSSKHSNHHHHQRPRFLKKLACRKDKFAHF